MPKFCRNPFLGLIILMSVFLFSGRSKDTGKVLVFSLTKGYYHTSIPAGIKAIQELGKENNFMVDTTRDASFFTDEKLKDYGAVIFLNTTGDVLNADQQVAFEKYI